MVMSLNDVAYQRYSQVIRPRLETYLFILDNFYCTMIQTTYSKNNYCCDGINSETKNEFEYRFSWFI